MLLPYSFVLATSKAIGESSTVRIFASIDLPNHIMTPQMHKALNFLHSNRPEDALKILQIMSGKPTTEPIVDFLLGIALSMLGKKTKAVDAYQRVIARDPRNAGAWLNLGADLYSLKRYNESLSSLLKAQEIEPNNPMIALNLGNVHKALENIEASLAAYELSLSLNPNYADAWSNYGDALCLLGRVDEALISYEKALEINPVFTETLNNLGLTHIEANRFDAGIAALNRALALNPNFVMAHNNLGIALSKTGEKEKGIAAYQCAIALNPKIPDPYFNLAEILAEMRQYVDAISLYEKAVELSMVPTRYLGTLLHTKMKICDWTDFDKNTHMLLNNIYTASCAISPFSILGIASTATQQKRCAEALVKKLYPSAKIARPATSRQTQPLGKIRIGYLSSDFYAHATAYLIAELFELHDRSQFEIFLFSYGKPPADKMRDRIMKSADAFYDLGNLSDPDAANQIRQIGIDILVDLKGHTEGSRLGILAQRPAPIQVHYLGYPGTLGAPFVDYLIADNILIKEEEYDNYSEKIVHLPGCYQVNDRNRHIAANQDSRTAHGLPIDGFVYCCFNNNWKITPKIFDVWMKILANNANSVLWLIEDNPFAANNLRKEAKTRGVSANQLVFAPKISLDKHLARHRHADLFLDTPYCNAHTTASDALWAGLPVLTIHGNTYAGRVGETLLNALGLNELVAVNLEHYEQIANALNSDPEKLSAIKNQLVTACSKGRLFDTPSFATDLEGAYCKMIQRANQGLAPDHIQA